MGRDECPAYQLWLSEGRLGIDHWVGEGAKPDGITPAPAASLRFQRAISHFLFPGNTPVFFHHINDRGIFRRSLLLRNGSI